MFQHNSGMAGAISTNLGTHMTICMYKNLIYTLYMDISPKHQSPRGDDVGDLLGIPPTGYQTEVTLMQIGIQATDQ
jgi:hypothetical protein